MGTFKLRCKNCGSNKFEKVDNTYVCQYCGNIEVVETEKKEQQKQTMTSEQWNEINQKNIDNNQVKFSWSVVKLIVCFLFGTFGIHKFLEKKYLLGILYFFTFGLFYIGWISDIFSYVKKINNEKQGKK